VSVSRNLTFLQEQDRADAQGNDAIAEYWQLVNDPANGFDPADRQLLIGVARDCGAAIARRADTIRRIAP
jgi:hypothetical protein